MRKIGSSWEEAVEATPEYTDDKVLSRYKIIKGKTLPENFKVNDVMILADNCHTHLLCPQLCTYIYIGFL